MAASEFEIVFLLIAIFLIFIKAIHVLMKRFDLPDVLGEVTIGFILGPSLLGLYYLKDHPISILSGPLGLSQEALDISGIVISFMAEFAVLLLLFEVGTEIDFEVLNRVKKTSISAALGGIVVPILAGLSFLLIVFQIQPDLIIPEGGNFTDVALFLGIALTATSIGVSTRIFLDLGKIKSKVAQTVVGAAVVDDIISVTALAITVTYVSGALILSPLGIIQILGEIVLFFVIAFFLFRYIVPWIVAKTKMIQDQSFVIFFSIAFMLLMAVLAQTLGLAPIIGAFTAGVIIGNEEDFLHIHRDIKPLANWIVPFFFVSIGLQINLIPILTPVVAIMGVGLAVVAILAKFIGGTVGSKLAGYDLNASRAVGLSMAAKGEVTLIFAVTAFDLGIFTLPLFAAVISLVLIDSLLIPTLLKFAINHWVVEDTTPLANPTESSDQNTAMVSGEAGPDTTTPEQQSSIIST